MRATAAMKHATLDFHLVDGKADTNNPHVSMAFRVN